MDGDHIDPFARFNQELHLLFLVVFIDTGSRLDAEG
jgi:hypothetical protein